MTLKSTSRQDVGELLQNVMQSEEESLKTGAFLHQVGKRKQEEIREGKDKEQVPALAPSWLPRQGTARMLPARQTEAQLRLCWRDPSLLLPEDSPAPDPGLLGLLGDVQYMCRWKSGKAEDFINVKQEK